MDWLYGTSPKYKSTRSITIVSDKDSTRDSTDKDSTRDTTGKDSTRDTTGKDSTDKAPTIDISESNDSESTTKYDTLSLLKDSYNDDIVLIETSTVGIDDSSDMNIENIVDNLGNKMPNDNTNNYESENTNYSNRDTLKETNEMNTPQEDKHFNTPNDGYDDFDNSDVNSINDSEIYQDNSDISGNKSDNSSKTDDKSNDTNGTSKNNSDDSLGNANYPENNQKSLTSNQFDSSENLLNDENAEGYDVNTTESLDDLENDLPADQKDSVDHTEEIDYDQEVEENYVGNLEDDCNELRNNKTRIYCKVYQCYHGILQQCY